MQHIDQINRELREITAKCTTTDLAVDPWPWPTSPTPLELPEFEAWNSWFQPEPPTAAEPKACLSTKAQILIGQLLNKHMDRAAAAGAISDEMVEIALWLCKPCQQPELYEYRNVPHTCNRCGLGSDAGWGYVCFRNDCPTKVTC